MMANKLTKEMFQEVIAFFVSEWGAMGPNGTMGFYTRSGEYFQVNYLSEETPYQKNIFQHCRAVVGMDR